MSQQAGEPIVETVTLDEASVGELPLATLAVNGEARELSEESRDFEEHESCFCCPEQFDGGHEPAMELCIRLDENRAVVGKDGHSSRVGCETVDRTSLCDECVRILVDGGGDALQLQVEAMFRAMFGRSLVRLQKLCHGGTRAKS